MKKYKIFLLVAMLFCFAANAQFTDLKNKPAKDQSHVLTIWYSNGWLWFFY